MPRRVSSILLVTLAALAACQDYNFNPVGKCVIQPGAKREEVAKIGTADVLFVVDDSGSMTPEQERLKANFSAFIDALADVQKDRVQNNLDPFEFHIAVTTTSVFQSWKVQNGGPFYCSGSPSLQCVIPGSSSYYLSNGTADISACSDDHGVCNDVIQTYAPASICGQLRQPPPYGVGTAGEKYPAGDFVAFGTNPRVLHFTKDLEWADWPNLPAGSKLGTLVDEFKQNIAVGACGSGMEQPFEAGKLALKKALRQDGLEQPVPQSEFLHENAKLVVVFVGDEDDCSNPNDGTRSLAFTITTSDPGKDICIDEQSKPIDQQNLFRISDYADFLTSLGRPFNAAFIYSAQLDTCQEDADHNVVCDPGSCGCQCPSHCLTSGNGCGPNEPGDCFLPDPNTDDKCAGFDYGTEGESRYHQLSKALRGRTLPDGSTVKTFEASVCEADWANTLRGIADLVPPVSGLTLGTQPADKDVVALSIQTADGNPRSYCDGPQIPVAGETFVPTEDWWFVDCGDRVTPSAVATTCIKVNPNPSAKCRPNAGESYVAFYLGKVPDAGCFSNEECNALFGNTTAKFECRGFSGTRETNGTPGTCLCKAE
jgi:hypothetical protein